MRTSNRLLLLVVLALLPLAACGQKSAPPSSPASPPPSGGAPQLPEGHPPIPSQGGPPAMGEVVPPGPGAGVGQKALVWDAPANWVVETPTSRLRRAQYKAPGPGGDGECVVYYFGPGEGGDPQSNAVRWAQQFKNAAGQPAMDSLKTSEVTVHGMRVTLVEASGAYQGGMAMGQPAPEKPDYMLLGAIAAGPDANWFFKFTGPRTTILAQRAAFQKMIESLRTGS